MSESSSSSVSSKDGRTRNWTFIVYDDSAPANWRDILNELHIPWVESPLHEFDVNPDGEIKKAHRHIVLPFTGKKSYEQVKAITDSLSSPRPEPVNDMRGICRYLIHRDNPEKFQYSFADIICHNGFDVSEYFKASRLERYDLIAEMLSFISSNNITEFTQFTQYCIENRRDDWFPLICDSCAIVVNMQIKSQRHGAPAGSRSPGRTFVDMDLLDTIKKDPGSDPGAGELQPGAESAE